MHPQFILQGGAAPRSLSALTSQVSGVLHVSARTHVVRSLCGGAGWKIELHTQRQHRSQVASNVLNNHYCAAPVM